MIEYDVIEAIEYVIGELEEKKEKTASQDACDAYQVAIDLLSGTRNNIIKEYL